MLYIILNYVNYFIQYYIINNTLNSVVYVIWFYITLNYIIEGSLEVKLPTVWADEKQRWEEPEKRRGEERRGEKRREEKKKEDQKRESLRRKKIQVREKVGKSRNTVFFQWFVAPEGRKVSLLKRRVQSHVVRWELKKCTPKSARRCGAKQISKSKCRKHNRLGPLLEVEMMKKSTLLWREAHFQVNMYKAQQARTTCGSWDDEKVHAVVARSTFPSQNVQNTPGSDHL